MASCRSSLFAFSTGCRLLSAVLPWLLMFVRVHAQNRSDEVRTLLSFRDANADSTSKSIDYWNTWNETDFNPCAWAGVTCTTNYTVEELDLSGWGLAGLSPDLAGLSNLTDLRKLDLSSNDLLTFPNHLGTLTALTELDFSRSNLFDNIPEEISACRNLRVISLQQNLLLGEIPSLLGLVNLQFLLLADNQLSGSFPKELGELSNLVSIDLSNNLLNGSIPALPKLTKLVDLTLDNNSFTEFQEPWSLSPKSLKYLSVSFNQLGGMIPSGIATLSNLQYLNMSHNLLLGNIPLEFPQFMENMLSLDLSQNQLTGEIPANMLQTDYTVRCVSLNLSHNLLSGDVPINGTTNSCFSLLDLSYNKLNGTLPVNIFSNDEFEIDLFWLQNNYIYGDIIDILDGPGLANTQELRLQNNLFTGDLSRASNTSFENITNGLLVIDLSNNDLRWSTSETIPDPIRETLVTLTIRGSLTEFRVGGNNFSGTSLPTSCFVDKSFGFGSLEVVDLSQSQLMGEILGAAFNNTCLSSLQFLNLSNNDLSGHVPESVVTLPHLGVFDVSNNHLFGPLPLFPFNSTLSYQSFFVGNDGLCGYPLSSCPQVLQGARIQWWVLLIIIGGCVTIVMASCLVAVWRWRVYHKKHRQDADLIKTLLEREATTLMPLRELKKATENFAKGAQIGEGGFGIVYIGKLDNGTTVAIKRSKQEGSEKDKEQFLNEVRILSQVNHRNLVTLLGCCLENKIAILVFEYVSNGTLQEHLRGKNGVIPLTWKQRLNIAVQTANALNYLHSGAMFPIYHRDVKSANILLDDNLNAKVADFGISKLAPIEATHVSTIAIHGTMGYIDPEYYTSYQLTDKSDVYSFGVVLLELISAKPPLDFLRGGEETSLVYFSKTHIERGDLQGLIDPTLLETYNDTIGNGRESILNVGRLAMKCLDMQSKARPSMHNILKELEIMWVGLNNKSDYLKHFTHKDDYEDLQHGFEDGQACILPKHFSAESSSSILQSNNSDIEMSQFFELSRSRLRSIG